MPPEHNSYQHIHDIHEDSKRREQPIHPTITVSPHKTHSVYSQLNQALAGGVAGFCTRSLTQPFDVLKIRFQLQVEPVSRHGSGLKLPGTTAQAVTETVGRHSSKYTSILQACRLIYREEGVRAFWKGHNAGQFMSVFYAIIQFWSYEQFRLGLSQMSYLSQHNSLNNFLSGGLAGTVATVIVMPFDVIRTRIVAQDHGCGYRSTFTAFPIILRTEGVRGFFRGLNMTLIQIGPMVGANFMFYKSMNDFAANLLDTQRSHLPTWCLLLTGGCAGVASKAIVYPLDFVKKRLQMQGFEDQRQTYGRNQRCSNMRQCIALTVREEGFMGFYKGIMPTLWKSGLTTALYFSVYDKCKSLLHNTHVKQ